MQGNHHVVSVLKMIIAINNILRCGLTLQGFTHRVLL